MSQFVNRWKSSIVDLWIAKYYQRETSFLSFEKMQISCRKMMELFIFVDQPLKDYKSNFLRPFPTMG